MRKSFSMLLALAAGISIMGPAAGEAFAAMRAPGGHGPVLSGPRPGGPMPGVHPHFGGQENHFHGHRHFRPYLFIAPPVYAYRSYDDSCHWLKRKAVRSGSRYWWHRYQECRWG